MMRATHRAGAWFARLLSLGFRLTLITFLAVTPAPPVAMAAALGSAVQANHEHGEKKEAAKPSIPDVEVVDQDGKNLHFYRDLVKDKVVAINFIFTTCTYICPMQGATFAKLQAALGDRLGRDVYLISVSTDPVTDTPERLKAWGAGFGAKAGWTLVTGKKDDLDQLLLAMTGDPAGRGDHSPALFIGNYDKGVWVREYALAEPGRYIKLFDNLAGGSTVKSSTEKSSP